MRISVGKGGNADCLGICILEVLIAMLIVAFSLAAIVNSYVVCAREADRAAYSLAAQSLALGRMEQVSIPPLTPFSDNTNFSATTLVSV